MIEMIIKHIVELIVKLKIKIEMTKQNLKSVFDPNTFFNSGWVNIPKDMIEKVIESEQTPCSKLEAMLKILLHTNYSEKAYIVKGHTVTCERGESVRSLTQWAKIFRWSRSKTQRFLTDLQNMGYIHFIKDSQATYHIEVLLYEGLINGPTAQKRAQIESNQWGENQKWNTDVHSRSCHNAGSNEHGNHIPNKPMGIHLNDIPYEEPFFMDDKYLAYLAKTREQTNQEGHANKTNQAEKVNVNKAAMTAIAAMTENVNANKAAYGNQTGHASQTEHGIQTGITKTGPEKHQEFMKFWDEYYNVTGLIKKNIGKAEREWNRLSIKEQQLAKKNIEDYFYSQGNTTYLLQAASYLANKAYLDEFYN